MISTVIRSLLLVIVLSPALPLAHAATFSWAEVQLTGASGVPNAPVHSYQLKGVIKGYGSSKFTSASFDVSVPPVKITSSTSKPVFATIWVQGKGRWDSANNEAQESFSFDGDVRGNFVSRLKCNADPWLKPTSCAVISANYQGDKGPIYDWPGMVKKAKLPLSAKAVNAALAAQLSQQSVAGGQPPPPPPPQAKSPDTPVKTATAKPAAPNAVNVPPALPDLADLASTPALRIAGKQSASWGSTVTLTPADARAVKDGACHVAFEHVIRNLGAAPSGGFSRRWVNQATAASLTAKAASIPAGATLKQVDTLALKGGSNSLVLGLDHLSQVKESNENNNISTLTVVVNGDCSAAPAAQQARGGLGSSRWDPASNQRGRLPAVKSPPSQPQPRQ